jgi:cytochrome c5
MIKVKYLSNLLIFGVITLCITKAQEAPIDPIKLFNEKKCNSCHSIESMGIPKSNEKSKAPDLSNVAGHGAELLTKYLKKEAEIDGKKHGISWKGTETELNAMVGWLLSVKPKKSN